MRLVVLLLFWLLVRVESLHNIRCAFWLVVFLHNERICISLLPCSFLSEEAILCQKKHSDYGSELELVGRILRILIAGEAYQSCMLTYCGFNSC
ncbi:hypothetical protein KP509_39G054300 [Ceratopteris richardii]|uniref:Secreted protein n=1 Tax=Ceratopteris richardii TaxID=49495 RepID=A0A8T2Q1G9_CERRI|nr:hypothetical protein KP509_39G054300 [Ceratopteris richardii]